MNALWALPVIIAVSLLLTWLLRRYALSRHIIDVPNARSSHQVPTPRGGGVAIVVSFLAGMVLYRMAVGALADPLVWALLGGGAGVAVLGFLDDHGHIAARWRLLGHFSAAIWVLYWLGGMPALPVFGMTVELGYVGFVVGALYVVWLLNLYNFMDGIDGIASVEAITTCLGGAVLYAMLGYSEHALLPVMLAASVAGFLFWNFPPARIFMGDAGSGFLGITLAVLSLQAGWFKAELLWSWIILLGVFVVDATWTLFRRLLRGDKVYEAHRSHAYRYASRRVGRHLPVTATVGVINLLWLLPWALLVGMGRLDGLVGVLVAYAPLCALAVYYKAGQLEAV